MVKKLMIEKVIQGNNLEVLRKFPDNYFDSVITDPPYGISFMGKKWDYDVPSVETWKEVLRVLKPGGHILVACGTRTQHRMAVNIEDAGFEIRDLVAWLYGEGFPKSHDISKAIDKELGAEREVIGTRKGSGTTGKNAVGNQQFVARNENPDGTLNITKPSTDLAKQYEGWGTALKPAMELWTLARKPLIGTVAENVMEYGTGGINIDECRVPTSEEDKYDIRHYTNEDCFVNDKPKQSKFQIKEKNTLGRFPANVIHDGSEEVVKGFPDTESSSGSFKADDYKQGGTATPFTRGDFEGYGDSGNASRFFYTAKASQWERNFGLENKEKYFYEGKNIPEKIKEKIKRLLNQ